MNVYNVIVYIPIITTKRSLIDRIFAFAKKFDLSLKNDSRTDRWLSKTTRTIFCTLSFLQKLTFGLT